MSYYSSFHFEAGLGKLHVYDFNSELFFSETEYTSMYYQSIVTDNSISRNANRALVNFINDLTADKGKLKTTADKGKLKKPKFDIF